MNRTIKKIKRGADHDDSIKDQYKMYKCYKDGMFVEIDPEQAKYYRQQCLNNLKQAKFNLSKIRLVNYKGFNELTIDLNNNVILIAANNGYGKTGVLEAIYLSLSWFFRLVYGSNQGWRFGDKYVSRLRGNDGMLVTLDIYLQNQEKKSFYKITSAKSLGLNLIKSEYADFKELAEMYAEFMNESIVPPMFSYYSVERGKNYPEGGFASSLETTQNRLLDRLYPDSSLTISANIFPGFIKWASDIKIKKSVQLAESTQGSIYSHEDAGTVEKYLHHIHTSDLPDEVKQKLITEQEAKLKYLRESSSARNTPNIIKMEKIIDMIFQLGCDFVDDITSIKLKYDEKLDAVDLVCVKRGCEISASYLSHGEKSTLSLLFDVALKLIQTCGTDDPFKGHGIIFIDEIELHLHPSWQQSLILKLRNAFPNVKIIATTHSPNILNTVEEKAIRKIEYTEDKFSIDVPEFSFGAKASDVQREIQDVDERSPVIEPTINLIKFKKMMKENAFDSSEADQLLEKILEWGDGRDPDVTKLKIDLELRRKRKAKKEQKE